MTCMGKTGSDTGYIVIKTLCFVIHPHIIYEVFMGPLKNLLENI